MSDNRTDDLVVNIAESPTGASKPGQQAPSAKERAREWLSKPRNKAIAGGSLAALLLIPVVVAPAVVMSQKNSSKKTRVGDWGAYRSVGSKMAYLDPLVRAARIRSLHIAARRPAG